MKMVLLPIVLQAVSLIRSSRPGLVTDAILPLVDVDRSLAPFVTGEDPSASAMFWEQMDEVTCDYGQKGVVVGAISGVDIALWDLKGQVLGVPMYSLMSGPFRIT